MVLYERTEVTPKREWTVGFTPKEETWFHRRANEAILVIAECMLVVLLVKRQSKYISESE
jgi:hypothetical protein